MNMRMNLKSMVNKSYFFIPVILLLSFWAGLFGNDVSFRPDILIDVSDFLNEVGVNYYQDPSTFARTAIEFSKNGGWFDSTNQWVIVLWPPGFVLFEMIIFKVFGLSAPFVLILLGANIFLLLYIYFQIKKSLLSPLLFLFALIFPFIFPVFRFFIFHPLGVVFGEAVSILLFLLGFFLAYSSQKHKNPICAVCMAGIFIGLSAYFRSQFEIFVTGMTLLSFFIYLYFKIFSIKNVVASRMLILFVVANCVMMPWRVHNFVKFDSARWVGTESLVYQNAGRTDAELKSVGAGWIVEGKGNVACTVDKSYCGKANKTEFYKSYFGNFLTWNIEKFSRFDDYWFSSVGNLTTFSEKKELIYNGALLLMFVFVFITALFRALQGFNVFSFFSFGFIFCNFLIFSLVHFEARYMYALKIYVIFAFIAAINELISYRRAKYE